MPPSPSPYQELVQRLISGPMTLEDLEKAAIEAALLKANSNVTTAAKSLGLGRTTIYRKMKRYGFH